MRSTKAAGRLPGVAMMGALALSSLSAHAQNSSPGSEKVAAEALFEEARNLVAGGKYAEACPKFVESERLDASPSTLLNLANCWEKSGRAATAWATYKQAESAASAAHRQDYVDTALRHARALAPTLARLTIAVQQPVEGLQVKRDGVLVGPAEWASPIPIDAGSHTFEASAPGYKAWATRIDVPHDGAQPMVTVPSLELVPVEATPPEPSPVTGAPAIAPPPSPQSLPVESTNGGAQRTTGLVIAGAGVVGFGVSGVLAIMARSKYSDSLSYCDTNYRNQCTRPGVSQRNDARSMGDAATVAFVLGAAAVVAGGVLWFTAPHEPHHANSALAIGIAPTIGGVVAAGAW